MFVEDGKVYDAGTYKEKTRVGCIYRRVSDEYMDPMMFEPSSLLGIPNVMQAYKAGNVALINAIGNGVADDKGIYYFVPKMVKYYLGEESILQNAPTYLPYFKDLEILEDGELVWRKADLRAFVVTGNETKVWKSGLTRFSRNPDSFVINSSQGGGFKDTWVMVE